MGAVGRGCIANSRSRTQCRRSIASNPSRLLPGFKVLLPFYVREQDAAAQMTADLPRQLEMPTHGGISLKFLPFCSHWSGPTMAVTLGNAVL